MLSGYVKIHHQFSILNCLRSSIQLTIIIQFQNIITFMFDRCVAVSLYLKYALYSIGALAIQGGGVPDGTGQIWLDNVQCRGTETRLIDCPANPLGTHNCGHSEDAGATCLASEWISNLLLYILISENSITMIGLLSGPMCTQGAIRLQGGSATQGRVEICNNNVWGTVCDDFWGATDAQVACRQLGFSTTGI